MPATNRLLLGWAALLSGAAALVYQILWVRTLGEVLGSTAFAVNTVLTVFFLGLGLGGWLFGRWSDRRRGAIQLVIGLEVVIALCGLLFPSLAAGLESLYDGMAPAEWSLTRAALVKGPLVAALLALPTIAMGGTLPALVRHVVRESDGMGARLGWIYGANTLGAAVGVALVVLVLIPRLGLQGAASVAAAFNLVAAGCAFAGRWRPRPDASNAERPGALEPSASTSRRGVDAIPRLATFVSGFLSIGLEVLWTRALAARFLTTVYSYATILFAYLLCLGLGAWLAAWLDRRGLATRRSAAWVLLAAGAAAMASVPLLAGMTPVSPQSGSSLLELRAIELAKAVGVMCVPVLLFGLNFPLLCRLAHREAEHVGRELGGMLVANTLGSVLAPLVFGFVALPRLGMRLSLLACGALAVLFALVVLRRWARASERQENLMIGLGSAAILLLGLVSLRGGEVRLWREAPTDRLLAYHEGAAASVAVVHKEDGTRTLKVDHSYRLGDSRTVFATRRQGLIPRLLGEDVQRMLFIGMGTGTPAGVAAADGASSVDVLEIVPGLGDYLPFFAQTNEDLARRLAPGSGVRLLEVDGRHFVRTSPRVYDAVVGDLFIPWRAGEGAMYTREHFEAVRERLAPTGLFVQWLPLYQLDPRDLATIAATFCAVFPEVEVFWLYFNVVQPAIGLVGSTQALQLDPARLGERMAGAAAGSVLERAGLTEVWPLLGSWIAGRERLAAFAADAPLETRDHPRIEFSAPLRRIGRQTSPAAASVAALLELGEPIEAAPIAAHWTEAERSEAGRHQRAIAAFHRGAALSTFAGDLEASLDSLAQAMAETPEWDWIAYNLEGLVIQAAQAGRGDLVRRAADALRASPVFAHLGHYHLAAELAREGDPRAARHAVEQALELVPTHEPSLRLRQSLGAARQ